MSGTVRRILAAAFGLVIAFPITSCAADKAAASEVERTKVTLPFGGGADVEQLKKSYFDVIDLLRKRAADEVRDAEFEPHIGSYPVYPREPVGGMQYFIGAITPKKGVFYVMPFGPYASLEDYRTGRVYWRKDRIEACRMELRWDRLSGGPFAPGLGWAGMYMSGSDCQPPPADQLAVLDSWNNPSAKPDYVVEGKAGDGEVQVALVREIRPKGLADRPFDAAAASTKFVGPGDEAVWAIPLIDQDIPTASVVSTRRSGLLAFFFDNFDGRNGFDMMCAAQGLSWSDIVAEPARPSMQTARNLCRTLITGYRAAGDAEARRRYEKNPATIQSIPQTLGN